MMKKIKKESLISIDSGFRERYPKNICKTNSYILPNNPLKFTKGSNLITINYPNHNLTVNDNIVIQNVEGISKTLINAFYLINNFNYAVIFFGDNMIDIDYKTYVNNLYATIEVTSQTENNILENICFNDLLGYKQIYVGSADIPQRFLTTIYPIIKTILTSYYGIIISNETDYLNYINKKCLFIALPTNYINSSTSYYQINQIFKIRYNHIAGIELGQINANFPISNINYQSNQTIYSVVDSDNFQIYIEFTSFGDSNGGGKNVQIMKIINTIPGYPNANNYVINLKKSFNNVTRIDLISTEIPYVDIIVKKNVNDKLYWKHIMDGDHVYMLQIDEGFYTTNTLLNKIQTEINKVERIVSNEMNKVYNNFTVNLETGINKITFTPYNITKLPDSLIVTTNIINSVLYYILTIAHHNSFVNVGDTVIISNASDVTIINKETDNILIDKSYINKEFTVYSVNQENNTYDVLIGSDKQINTTFTSNILNGGKNIIVKTKTKVSFLFDKEDTMGEILGFLNVGTKYSIINFSSEISNKDNYIGSINSDSVGNILSYSNGFINLSGKYTYILMFLNDIEYVYTNTNLPAAFAKIQLNGNPGDILFNTYIENPDYIYCKAFPISNLSQLTISFMYPDGSIVDFRNINHCFTLKIIEEFNETDEINLNSQTLTVVNEIKRIK